MIPVAILLERLKGSCHHKGPAINGPLFAETILHTGKEHRQQAHSILKGSHILPSLEFVETQVGLEANKPKPNRKDSIKGKKALARLRVA